MKLLARLGRDRITKEQPSQGFEENRVFQEVFSVLHDALDVRSTSGSWGGMNARNALRACRLKDVTPRVLWHWLNQGIPFYLYYYPDRKSASYGIGTTQPWDGWTAPTFFTRGRGPVTHIDFTRPYCEAMRQRLLKAARAAGETLVAEGTYGATQGPRLETAAEISRLERDGAHLVGMTGMPEAALAREIGLCYAAIAIVVNHAAGRGASARGIRLEDIRQVSERAMGRVRAILEQLVMLDDD